MSELNQIKIPKWKALISAARIPFLQVTIIPVALAVLLAIRNLGQINPLLATLTLILAILLHLSVNVIHEYYDWKSGTDNINVNAIRPFTGGSGMIQIGALTPKQELAFGWILLISAMCIGIYVMYLSIDILYPLLVIGLIAVFSIVFYTGSPIKLAHRGVGEFFIFLNFGPLMTLGPYLVLTKSIHIEPIIIGTLVGLFTTAIIIINEFPDKEADEKAGKRHLVVRLGLSKSRYLYATIMLAPYILLGLLIALGYLPILTGIAFLALPITIGNIKWCYRHYNDPKTLFKANIGTIKNHLIFGILLIVAYVLDIMVF